MSSSTGAKKTCKELPPDRAFLKITAKNAPALALVLVLSLVALKIIFARKNKQRRTAKGLSVFITGCDSGIGYESAKRLDHLGFKVFAGCHFPEGDGAKRLKSVSSERLIIVGIDVTDNDQVKAAADFVKKNLPFGSDGLDCLVNNAGAKLYGDFAWYTMAQCEHQVNVTLLGTVRVTKHFLPLVKAAQGRIVTFTGINGRVAFPQLSVYSATKFALEGFCRSLRYEMSDVGVYVSLIQPGDLSLSLGLLQSYKAHAEEMWASMVAEERVANRESFERWKSQVNAASRKDKRKHKDTFRILLSDLEDFVLSVKPQMRYVSAPFPYRHLYTVLGVLPEAWRVKLILYSMKRQQKRLDREVLANKERQSKLPPTPRQRSATASW